MRNNFLKMLVLRKKARFGLALFASLVSIWCALTPGTAQSRNPKRITSVQVGEASEGARVTVVSDGVLSDYEAFRRGDRFYVRIPLADFTAGKPSFRGDGFEDVQVQEIGDSVVLSFKLQPGASARVDQRSNRLDVIFSSPNRTVRTNRSSSGSTRGAYVPQDGIVRLNNSQSTQYRQRDAAGPMPPDSPGSPKASRERVVSGRASEVPATRNQSSAANVRQGFSRSGGNRSTGNTGSSNFNSAAPSIASQTRPSPNAFTPGQTAAVSKPGSSPAASKFEPSPVPMPSTSSSYPAIASSTPASPLSSPTASKSPSLIGSTTWKSRRDMALQWVKSNRQATLIGGGVGLLLLVLLAAFLLRRRRTKTNAKRPGKALAQPKHSPDIATGSPVASAPLSPAVSNTPAPGFANVGTAPSSRTDLKAPAEPATSANGAAKNGTQQNVERARFVPEQARVQSNSVKPNHAWVPVSSAPSSSASEEQEREVFEL